MIGPMLVHYRKEFRSYNYFFSTVIGLNRQIAYVKVVGTDGEKNLADAALHNFSQAAHVCCFRHLQQNIEMHLRDEQFPADRDEQFPADIVKEYTHDIFGWSEINGVYHEGLMKIVLILIHLMPL